MGEIKKLGYYVNGSFKESNTDKYTDAYNPSTGEVIAKVPCCTPDEVEEAIAAAKAAFPGWSATPVKKRVAILYKLRDLLYQHMDELTMSVARENGKNWAESEGDVLKAIEGTEQAISAPSLMMGESLMDASSGYDTVSYRMPLGVFAGIVPFNFPAMIPMGWMTPICIACGNTIVLKAATFTPQTCMRIAELYKEAGLPDGVINIVTCSRHEAEISGYQRYHLRGIHLRRKAHLLHRRSQRQTGAGSVRGQEPCAGSGGCSHRAYRGRNYQRFLRMRRRALHGASRCGSTGKHR